MARAHILPRLKRIKKKKTYSTRLDSAFMRLRFVLPRFVLFFFFYNHTILPSELWTVHGCTVYGFYKFHFLVTFSLKIDHMILFTHLKIISLQYFQLQFLVSTKISSIQTDHTHKTNKLAFKRSESNWERGRRLLLILPSVRWVPFHRYLWNSRKCTCWKALTLIFSVSSSTYEGSLWVS